MGDKDPRLSERLNRFYDHIEGEMPPAGLEHFDAGAAGRHARVVHVWAGVAGVAAVAAAVGALVVGLSSRGTTGPRPAPATSHRPAQQTATPTPSAATFPNFQPVSFSAISESQYWVIGYDGTTCAPCNAVLLHTVDGGATFHQIAAPPVLLNGGVFAGVRFADASDGYAFGSTLWSTHDGGGHWKQIAVGGNVPELEPGAGGFVYAVVQACRADLGCGNDYKVERSSTSGDTWSTLSVPGQAPGEFEWISVHGKSLWVMQFGSGRLWISRNAGASFSQGTFPCDASLTGSLSPVSDSVIWAFCATGTKGGPVVSTDGGRTWSPQRDCCPNGGEVAGVSASRAFVSDASVALSETRDGGATFHPILNWQQMSRYWGVGFTDASVGYAVLGSPTSSELQLWRTTDGGAHWKQVSFAS